MSFFRLTLGNSIFFRAPVATARLIVAYLLAVRGVHSSAVATGNEHCGILRQSRFHLRRSLPRQSNLVCVNAFVGESISKTFDNRFLVHDDCIHLRCKVVC